MTACPGRRGRRQPLPHRLGAHRRHGDPAGGRLHPRRRRRPGSLCRRTRAVAGGRRSRLATSLIIQAARHKAIDRIRRDQRLREIVERDAPDWQFQAEDPIEAAETIPDDRLRLIFTCCHPALRPGSAGRADASHARRSRRPRRSRGRLLVSPPTMAQRLVRAKRKIRDAQHPVRRAGTWPTCRSGWMPC